MAIKNGILTKKATAHLLEERGIAAGAEFGALLPLDPNRIDDPEYAEKVSRYDYTLHELALVGTALDCINPDPSVPEGLRWLKGARRVLRQRSPVLANAMIFSSDISRREDQISIFREMDDMTLPHEAAMVKDFNYAQGVALGHITLVGQLRLS